MIGALPESVKVGGKSRAIRTDFRDILRIIEAFNDPELEANEKVFVCLFILYKDLDGISPDDYEEAYKKAIWFIDLGEDPDEAHNPRVMDWEQDERILFPAINSVAGFETRNRKHLHWWTFMGYFMEIREGTFSQVLTLRQKKAKGKRFEKWEREFWAANKKICKLKPKLTHEEEAEKARLKALLDG